MWAERNTVHFRVWRSLVSRLNGVQEAASSNLVTRTNTEYRFSILCVFFRSFAAKNQRALGREAPFDPPPACRTQSASHWFESSHSDQHRVSVFDTLCFFVLLSQRTSGLLGAKRRLICAGSKPVAPGRVSSDGTSRFFAYFLRSLHKNVHFLAVFSLFVEEHLFLLLAEERKSMYYKRCTGEILVRKSDDSPGWVRWTHYAEGKTHC